MNFGVNETNPADAPSQVGGTALTSRGRDSSDSMSGRDSIGIMSGRDIIGIMERACIVGLLVVAQAGAQNWRTKL